MGAMCPENLVVQNNKGLTHRFTDEGNKKSLFVAKTQFCCYKFVKDDL